MEIATFAVACVSAVAAVAAALWARGSRHDSRRMAGVAERAEQREMEEALRSRWQLTPRPGVGPSVWLTNNGPAAAADVEVTGAGALVLDEARWARIEVGAAVMFAAVAIVAAPSREIVITWTDPLGSAHREVHELP